MAEALFLRIYSITVGLVELPFCDETAMAENRSSLTPTNPLAGAA